MSTGHNFGSYYDWSQNQQTHLSNPRTQAPQYSYAAPSTITTYNHPRQPSSNDTWYSSAQNQPGFGSHTNSDTQTQLPQPRSAYDDHASYGHATSEYGVTSYLSHAQHSDDSRSNHASRYSQLHTTRPTYTNSTAPSYSPLTQPSAIQQQQHQAQRVDRTSSPASNMSRAFNSQTPAGNAVRHHPLPNQHHRTSSAQASQGIARQSANAEGPLFTATNFLRHENAVSPEAQNRTLSPQLPQPTTVNPSEVYDAQHEYERHRRAREAQARETEVRQAEARSAEARAAEARDALSLPTQHVGNTSTQKQQQVGTNGSTTLRADSGKKLSSKESKPGKKKAGSGSIQVEETYAEHAAAAALVQTANSTSSGEAAALELQMKEMFKRMREFNAKDPQLLARLWEEERDTYLANQTEDAQKRSAGSPPNIVTSPSRASTSETPVANSSQPRKSEMSKSAKPSSTQSANASITNAQNRAHEQQTPIPTSARPVQGGQTFWPANKKAELAATVSKYLATVNKNQMILDSDIMHILDSNPSYVQLCENIETRGLKIDRALLARTLLAAVPNMNGKADKTKEENVSRTANTSTGQNSSNAAYAQAPESTAAVLTEAEKQLLSAESLVDSKGKKAGSRPKKGPPKKDADSTTTKHPKTERKSNVAEVRESTNARLPLDPGLEGLDTVKQFVESRGSGGASATKSKDTAKSSKSQLKVSTPIPAAPATKEEKARKRTFGDLVDLTQLSEDDEELAPLPKRQEVENTPLVDQLPSPPTTNNSTHEEIKQTTVAPNVQAPGHSPLDVEPKLAPTVQNPLQPQAQSNETPLPPHPPSTNVFGNSLPPIPHDHPARSVVLVEQLDRWKAIRRSTYDPKTIARDVLLASGRHPDIRHLNTHLETLKQAFAVVDNNADLGTFRWDVVDPGGPAPGSGALLSPTAEPQVEVEDLADDEDEAADSVFNEHRELSASRRNGGDVVVAIGNVRGPVLGKKGKPRGRPSMSKFRVTGEINRPAGPEQGDPAVSSKKSQDKREDSRSVVTGYSALRAAQSGEGAVKKKGRPVGWRKWMQKDGSGTPAATPKPKEPEPEYQVYKCEWKDCGAELHNLDTLRRHIHKLHRNDNNLCGWTGCGKVRTVTDHETHRTSSKFESFRFSDLASWKGHIEAKHLTPIAWKLGDGPTGGVSDHHDSELSEAYMSDSHGRRVTPRIVIDDAAGSADISAKKTAEEKARDLEKDAEKRKQNMGPGMDKGGARLANDKRRQGFLDDDDTVEILDENDD